jgi:hypothetical protein
VLLLLVSLLLVGLLTVAGMIRCGLADPLLLPFAGAAMVMDELAEAGVCLNGNIPRPVVYGLLDANADIRPAVSGGCIVFCHSRRWTCRAVVAFEDL